MADDTTDKHRPLYVRPLYVRPLSVNAATAAVALIGQTRRVWVTPSTTGLGEVLQRPDF